jgi:hypothetical protein
LRQKEIKILKISELSRYFIAYNSSLTAEQLGIKGCPCAFEPMGNIK